MQLVQALGFECTPIGSAESKQASKQESKQASNQAILNQNAIFVYLGQCCNTNSDKAAMAPRPLTGLVVTQSPGGWFHAGGRLNEFRKNTRRQRRCALGGDFV
jgi:hypothetical protein